MARALGADGVELDVRRTADGVAVVHHDPHVEGYGLVFAQPFAALRARQPHVPTLAEALDVLDGLFVNIEMKCLPWDPDPDAAGDVARHVAEVIAQRSLHEQVVVSSFDLDAVTAVRGIDAAITAGWLTHQMPVATAAPIAAERGLAWLHPDRTAVVDDADQAVALAHELGLRLDVWTVNDPDDVRVLARAGVDAIITDVPDVALDVLNAPNA